MIVECTRGFGRVEDPRTGEEIDVQEPFETDRATFEALQARYPGFVAVNTPDKDAETTDAEPAVCGTEMTDGSICQRPAGECGYHG